MYFASFDPLHTILALLFVAIAGWIVFFRHKKYLYPNENGFPVSCISKDPRTCSNPNLPKADGWVPQDLENSRRPGNQNITGISLKEKTINYTMNKNLIKIRIFCLISSIILLTITILEPVGFIGNSRIQPEGMDCVWILDVSASMDVMDGAEDTHPVSRLSKAKSMIENFIITHPENRYGLVIFAGTARLISPLTSEHFSLLTFLASIDSKSIREGGTNFQDALSLAVERFPTEKSATNAIILLSDGGDMESTTDKGIFRNILQGKHVTFVTVGIGKTEPSPIPVGKNPLGDTVYKKYQWETVLSGLERETLKSLAEMGNGDYLEGASIEKKLDTSLRSVSRQALRTSQTSETDGTIHFFLVLGFFFFLVFLLLPSSFLKRWNDE